jgi:kumamolisin
LQTYFGRLGLKPPSIVDVPLAGASSRASGNLMVDAEVTLDIEVLGAAAPAAQLVIYYAPNTTDGWVRAVHAVVADETHKPSVLSISWGQIESQWPAQAVRAIEEALTTAALLGITVCASTGDHGSADGAPQGVHVSYPASSSYVLACGGTKLGATNNEIKDEVVWNELGNPDAQFPGATGGGISDLFVVPAFQASVDVPPSANDHQKRGRGVPDVAANADPSSGYLVTVDGVTTVTGGTSAATPLWAALIARINESLNGRVGLIHPQIYRLQGGSAFRAVTSGNNGAYQAGPGWNACAGWGTPRGDVLLAALQADKGQLAPQPASA